VESLGSQSVVLGPILRWMLVESSGRGYVAARVTLVADQVELAREGG
jgi:hypothetical protein